MFCTLSHIVYNILIKYMCFSLTAGGKTLALSVSRLLYLRILSNMYGNDITTIKSIFIKAIGIKNFAKPFLNFIDDTMT